MLLYALNSLNLRKLYLDPNHPYLAIAYNNAGLAYSDLDYLDDALNHLFLALAIWENTNPKDIRSCATCYSNIGQIYEMQADHTNALKYKFKSLELWKQIYGNNDHPNLAIIYNNIAITLNSKHDHLAALDCMMEALRICEKHFFRTIITLPYAMVILPKHSSTCIGMKKPSAIYKKLSILWKAPILMTILCSIHIWNY